MLFFVSSISTSSPSNRSSLSRGFKTLFSNIAFTITLPARLFLRCKLYIKPEAPWKNASDLVALPRPPARAGGPGGTWPGGPGRIAHFKEETGKRFQLGAHCFRRLRNLLDLFGHHRNRVRLTAATAYKAGTYYITTMQKVYKTLRKWRKLWMTKA